MSDMTEGIGLLDVAVVFITIFFVVDFILGAMAIFQVMFPAQAKAGGRMLLEVMPFTRFGRSLSLSEASETMDNLTNMVNMAVDVYSEMNKKK